MNRREFVAMAPVFPAAAVSASLVLRENGKESIELSVSVLKIQAGDTLVLSTDRSVSLDTAERIKAYVAQLVPGIKAMILSDGIKLEGVLRGPE